MRTNIVIEGAKVFNVKPLGSNGCRFAIKINSKKQDGSYTKGTFINCVLPKENLISGEIYNLEGFLADNEYMDKNSIEIVIVKAILAGNNTNQLTQQLQQPQQKTQNQSPNGNHNNIDKIIDKQKNPDWNPFDSSDDDTCPF